MCPAHPARFEPRHPGMKARYRGRCSLAAAAPPHVAAHGSGYAPRSRPLSPSPHLCGCCGLRCWHPCPLKARRVGQVSAGYQTPPGSGLRRLVRVSKPTTNRPGAGGAPPQCPRVDGRAQPAGPPTSAPQPPSAPRSRTTLRSSGVSSCRPRYAAPAGAAARAALARPPHTAQPDRRGPGKLEAARQADRGTGTGSRRQVRRRRPWARLKPAAPCHPTVWKPPFASTCCLCATQHIHAPRNARWLTPLRTVPPVPPFLAAGRLAAWRAARSRAAASCPRCQSARFAAWTCPMPAHSLG